ncbi:Fic family protein [Spirosoma montaniterrae]|uniref:Cell filamentation protein Fic n=1 Tax=Spirosoma montaniterrae TaxID=1178516 RepID=A0A1P9X1R3_9BACT|nr:Fic/DOC family N-terminal domain-containing protein [Spirosoma montaniterrae]AQG81571.1 cell filamentation protein Fic [Spirosoma montaniterrae]
MKRIDVGQFDAGHLIKRIDYKSFEPSLINHEWAIGDPQISKLLEEATLNIGKLDAFSVIVPDVSTFIRMHVVKEATTSSRIEGTRTEIDEALTPEKDLAPEKLDDWNEVQNYIRAMDYAIGQLDTLPLSSRLFRQTHSQLLSGVRGREKQPGEYRRSQNWIGGASIRDAVFIPPHHSSVDALMGDLEFFLNNDQISVPNLIRIAIAHYQFETIHPFLDGNGRLGRLMITLYLVRSGMLHKPTLYLSDFFARNKTLYYDNLMGVRTHNRLEQWLKFFLVAVKETAEKGIDTFQHIMALREEIEHQRIFALGKRIPTARLFMHHLYAYPVVTDIPGLARILNVSRPTAGTLVNDFTRLGILRERTGFQRNRLFVFDEYLKLFS